MRTLSALALVAILTGCADGLAGPEAGLRDGLGERIVDAEAVVHQPAAGVYLLVIADPEAGATAYGRGFQLGDGELPSGYQRPGLRVVFSGEALPIPPHVRMYGQPLRLTAIRAAR